MVNATRQVARDQQDSSAVTQSEQDVIRSVGSLEHLFWLLDQHHFVHFAVTALISGETSPRDWRRALDRLQKRHPILSVCIDGEPDSAPLFRQAGAAPIPLRILEEEPELRWEAEVGKELATPFPPYVADCKKAAGPGGGDGAGRRVPGFGEERPGIRNVGVSPETEFAKIVAIVPILRRFADLRDEVIE
jgi:hypothetical protein